MRVKGKRIAVLGGGDAAFDYAINLKGMGGAVTILSRSEPTCLPLLAERARERGIGVLAGCDVKNLVKTSAGMAVACEGEACPGEVVCEMVVIAHGREPRLGVLDRDLRERICVDHPPETGVPGLYLAGDVARGRNRQAAIAVGDGVLAAMIIERSTKDRDGGRRH